LTAANALNDERRAFIEAVLSGVPASVLGRRCGGRHHGQQRGRRQTAVRDRSRGLADRRIDEVFPQVAQIVAQAQAIGLRSHQSQAT